MHYNLLPYFISLSFCAVLMSTNDPELKTVDFYCESEQNGKSKPTNITFNYAYPESFEFLNTILSSGMKETTEKRIKLPEFNSEELKTLATLLKLLDRPAHNHEAIAAIKNQCAATKDFTDHFFTIYNFAEQWGIKPLSLGLTSYFVELMHGADLENAHEIIKACPYELKGTLKNLIGIIKSKKHMHKPKDLLEDHRFVDCLQLPIIQKLIYSDFSQEAAIETKVSTESLDLEPTLVAQKLFFHNNKLITYDEKNISCYDPQTGKEVQSIKTNGIRALAFGNDIFATGGMNGQIHILDASGTFKTKFAPKSVYKTISCLDLAKDEALLAAGTQNGTVQILQLPDLKIKFQKYILNNPNILSLVFSSNKLFAGTTRELLKLDPETKAIEKFDQQKLCLSAPFYAINLLNDNTLITACGTDVGVIDLRTNSLVKKMSRHASTVTSIAHDANNFTVFSGSKDNAVRVWDIRHDLNPYTFGTPSGVMAYDEINKKLFTANNNKIIVRSFRELKSCKTLLEEKARGSEI